MIIKQSQKNPTNFYELALLLADGQSRQNDYRWGDFIDNLSRICDDFADSISPKRRIGDPSRRTPSQSFWEAAVEPASLPEDRVKSGVPFAGEFCPIDIPTRNTATEI